MNKKKQMKTEMYLKEKRKKNKERKILKGKKIIYKMEGN